ncbi:CHAT domain-containing protein [uncultured Roseibium sp.]|uniref:CHAT domain-containing protein n=1 Tax=uncultured Roseibium sp. TaxID=1936171 RepID=UPI0026196DCE|nr:CHAT domain-containing protein [uncultured Roseibium sp.]
MNALAVFPIADATHQIIQLGESTNYLITSSHSEPLEISAKSDQVKSLSSLLRGSLADICRRGYDFVDEPLPDREAALLEVAQIGRSLFKALMPEPAHRDWFRNEIKDGDTIIQVMSTAVSVPWEALYLAEELSGIAHVEEFLGYKSRLIRNAFNKGQQPFAPGDSVLSNGQIGMGIVEDDQLDSVGVNNDSQILNVARKGTAIKELHLGKLEQSNCILPMANFLASEDQPKQIVHFDCHLEVRVHADTPVIQHSKVRVTEKVLIHYNDFASMPLTNGPFVFFNVCYGGSVQSVSLESYASLFRQNGASCVVTSETKIGDGFAAMFAGAFYACASTGKSVAAALMEARKWVLNHHRNPSALFYTMYAFRDRLLPVTSVPAGERQEFSSKCGFRAEMEQPAA